MIIFASIKCEEHIPKQIWPILAAMQRTALKLIYDVVAEPKIESLFPKSNRQMYRYDIIYFG